ncbi:MAG: P-II family nitrogen regulator [Ilumatobacteraceae bacterium]
MDFVPKVRLDILVTAEMADRIVTVVVDAARTDKIGDGKVWTTPVRTVTRVRTGEMDIDAL